MKKTEELKQLRSKNQKELKDMLKENYKKCQDLQFSAAFRKNTNVKQLKNTRLTIARIWTIMSEANKDKNVK